MSPDKIELGERVELLKESRQTNLNPLRFGYPQGGDKAHQITRYLASLDKIEQQAQIDLLNNIAPVIQELIETEK